MKIFTLVSLVFPVIEFLSMSMIKSIVFIWFLLITGIIIKMIMGENIKLIFLSFHLLAGLENRMNYPIILPFAPT